MREKKGGANGTSVQLDLSMQMHHTGNPQDRGEIGRCTLDLYYLSVKLADELRGREMLTFSEEVENLPEFVFEPHTGYIALQAQRAGGALITLTISGRIDLAHKLYSA